MPDPALETFTRLFGPEFGHGKAFDLAPLKRALATPAWRKAAIAPVIHVAGTNGKGSTIAFMRAIAEAAGMKTHVFTKPHLFRLTERFVVASEPVREEALIDAAERVYAVAPELTQFDAQVAAALLLFRETPADVTLIETGMGGRDDSTNVVEPALTVLTSIGLDHQDALGPTLADIAAHKAGVLKRHVEAVTARMDEAIFRVIQDNMPFPYPPPTARGGVDWDAYESGGRLVVQTEWRTLDLPLPALHGPHQIDNAGLAVTAMQYWRNFDDDAFAAGVSGARLPGRLQPLTRGTFSAPVRARGGEVWVDGGHNADAAAALARALSNMKARRSGENIVILGLRARKDAAAFVSAIAENADRIIAIPLAEAHVPADEIAALARGLSAPSLAAAMEIAAGFPAPRVLICGSFLIAAEALAAERV